MSKARQLQAAGARLDGPDGAYFALIPALRRSIWQVMGFLKSEAQLRSQNVVRLCR